MPIVHENPNSDEDRLNWLIDNPGKTQFLMDLAATETDAEKRRSRVRFVIDHQKEKERGDQTPN